MDVVALIIAVVGIVLIFLHAAWRVRPAHLGWLGTALFFVAVALWHALTTTPLNK